MALVAMAAVSLFVSACQRVPLLAPTGSTITLTASTTALSANGTTTIIAQVLEAAGTPPHAGTHVTLSTTLGRVEPSEGTTDVNGRVVATFLAGGANGVATITALSGGATTGTAGAIKIAVGTSAVGRVNVNASPTSVPSTGGSSTITALVIDTNGNPLVGTPVSFTTTAGTLSSSVVLTDGIGSASSVLTTNLTADVTASVGAQVTTTTGTPPVTTSSGGTSGTVKVTVSSAPSIAIEAPTSISRGLPASFKFTVTAAATNGLPVREVTVDWGDGSVQSLGSFTGTNTSTHTFQSDGAFVVKATVVDVGGNSNSSSSPVSVLPLARPSISVTATPTTPQPLATATFTFTIKIVPPAGVSVVSSSISYGDGTSDELGGATEATRSHTYSSVGTKNVVVTVSDTAGRTSTGSTSVTVF